MKRRFRNIYALRKYLKHTKSFEDVFDALLYYIGDTEVMKIVGREELSERGRAQT